MCHWVSVLFIFLSLNLYSEEYFEEYFDDDSHQFYHLEEVKNISDKHPSRETLLYSIESEKALIKGIRYKRANSTKPPIILYHGLQNTTFAWKKLAHQLWLKGHDVWMFNLRGHGDGELKTKAKSTLARHWGIEGNFSEDLPVEIDFVHRESKGKKALIMGHSLGGLTVTRYSQGIRPNLHGRQFAVSDHSLSIIKKKILGVIGLAPAGDMSSVNPAIKFFVKSTYRFLRFFDGPIHLPYKKNLSKHQLEKSAKLFTRLFKHRLLYEVTEYLPKGLLEVLNRKDRNYYLDNGVGSIINTPLWLQLGHAVDAGELYTWDRSYNLGRLNPSIVPTLFIGGTTDILVGNDEVRRQAHQARGDYLEVDDGHLFFFSDKNANGMTSITERFIKENSAVKTKCHEVL